MNHPPPFELDVRPLLASSRPPMAAILNAVNRLAPGQPLRLITPMEPRPLYDLLARRGFTPEPTQRADGAWEVLFQPGASAASSE